MALNAHGELEVTLKDGTRVGIRPILPEDEARLVTSEPCVPPLTPRR